MLFEPQTLPGRTTTPVVAVVVSKPTPPGVAAAAGKPYTPSSDSASPDRGTKAPWAILAACGLLFLWAFYSTFELLVLKWIGDPQYSHGFLVPLFSLYLLWRSISGMPWRSNPRPFLAMGLLAIAFALRLISGGLFFVQLDGIALVLSLMAMSLVIGGNRMLRVTAPAIVFLLFMFPLPYELERNVGGPLKMIATQASTFILQTLGYPAVAEGNVILIDEIRLGVIDACSGLKMLVTFSAFAFGAVLILDRSWFEKALIMLGIVPIAIITNVLRITATGVFYTLTNDKAAQTLAHDYFGFAMMPVGLVFLALQLWILGRLVVRPTTKPPISAAYHQPPRLPSAPLPA